MPDRHRPRIRASLDYVRLHESQIPIPWPGEPCDLCASAHRLWARTINPNCALCNGHSDGRLYARTAAEIFQSIRSPGRLEAPLAITPRLGCSYIPFAATGSSMTSSMRGTVAIPLGRLLGADGLLRPAYRSAEDVKKAFQCAPASRLVLVCSAKDRVLEKFWSSGRRRETLAQLSTFRFSAVLGCNFSAYADDPRMVAEYAIQRCNSTFVDMQATGVPAIPSLQWQLPEDLDRQIDWIEKHPVELRSVALCTQGMVSSFTNLHEGESGVSNAAFDDLMHAMERLHTRLPDIGFVVVGASTAGRTQRILRQFPTTTLINGLPIHKALHGREVRWSGTRLTCHRGPGAREHLVGANLASYTAMLRSFVA